MTCTCDGRLRLVSLFDGIGGFPLAFGRAGIPTVATVEIDKAAAAVTAEHFPDAQHFADVTEVTPDDLLAAGFCPVHGIYSAGWPCTDLSLAGLRLGLGGARSGLVGEVFRLLLGLRPRWVVLENVPGLLSSVCPCPGGGVCDWTGRRDGKPVSCATGPHVVRGGACGRTVRRGRATGSGRCMALHGGGMGTVLRSLGQCGYGLAYRVLDARHFGVPQRRRRVVIVGRLGDAAGAAEVLLEPEGGAGHPHSRRAPRPGTAHRTTGVADGTRREVVAAIGLSGIGGNGGPDDNAAQGGHLIAVPETAGTLTAREGKEPDSDVTTTLIPDTAFSLRAEPGEVGQGWNVNYIPTSVTGEVTHALTAEGADASEDGTGGAPIVADLAQITSAANRSNPHAGDPAPTLAAGSQPVAFGHTNGLDVQASTEVTPTLRAGHDVGGGSVAAASGVRRLTPVECERLQGFPDGWTAKAAEVRREGNRWVRTGRVVEQADSPRYRGLGNSIAVPVFGWVADGIVAVDGEDG